VEVIHRANAAFNQRDWDGWRTFFHPDAVYYEGTGYLDTPSVLRGPDEMRRAVEVYWADLDGFKADIVELIDVGDKAFCLTRWSGTGKSSGLLVELLEAIVYTFRDGVVVEGRVFPTREEALEAVGLREKPSEFR
jgi:ketosteroid isomerase-like protein